MRPEKDRVPRKIVMWISELAIYCKERRNQHHTSLPSPCHTTGWALSRSVGSCDHLASNRSSWDQNIVIFPFVPFVSLALCRRKYFNISQYFTLCCPIIEMIASLTWELDWTGLIEWELNIKNWPEFDPPPLRLIAARVVCYVVTCASLLMTGKPINLCRPTNRRREEILSVGI